MQPPLQAFDWREVKILLPADAMQGQENTLDTVKAVRGGR